MSPRPKDNGILRESGHWSAFSWSITRVRLENDLGFNNMTVTSDLGPW